MKRVAALLGIGVAVGAHAYPEGGPPAHTGGFGEPSCHACHFDGPLARDDDSIRIEGLPARFKPGRTYRLTLEFDHGSPAAGFQLSARDTEGRQAGTLVPVDGRTGVATADAVCYLGQTGDGVHADGRWTFEWRAPGDTRRVVFHVAANAANDDRSEFGDRIVLYEILTSMERR